MRPNRKERRKKYQPRTPEPRPLFPIPAPPQKQGRELTPEEKVMADRFLGAMARMSAKWLIDYAERVEARHKPSQESEEIQ